ncbi:MAG: hypothetical protein ACK56F_10800, partial [bacterium]
VALIIKYRYHDTDDNKVNKIDVIENSSIILPASMFEHYLQDDCQRFNRHCKRYIEHSIIQIK